MIGQKASQDSCAYKSEVALACIFLIKWFHSHPRMYTDILLMMSKGWLFCKVQLPSSWAHYVRKNKIKKYLMLYSCKYNLYAPQSLNITSLCRHASTNLKESVRCSDNDHWRSPCNTVTLKQVLLQLIYVELSMLVYTWARKLILALMLTVCDDSWTHRSCKHEFIDQKEENTFLSHGFARFYIIHCSADCTSHLGIWNYQSDIHQQPEGLIVELTS